MKKYSLKTLGCKANLYDSQLIEAELQKRGWQPANQDSEADLCIVNSCTVTDEADRQSKRMAAQAGARTKTRVLMTGCGAEITPEAFANSPGIDFVIGNQNKPRLVDLVLEAMGDDGKDFNSEKVLLEKGFILGGVADYSAFRSKHPIDREWPIPESSFMLPPVHMQGETGRRRGFLKVQEGCNSFCTYCIIPYGRGPSRSLPITALVEQVRTLVSQGIREVVITGTNIGDYGIDQTPHGKPLLELLVSRILEETSLERLRIGSLDPKEITSELQNLYAKNTRLCAHFHVSLQSPHSRTLKFMKRKYSAEDSAECLESISTLPAPLGGVYVGMDVITGFPGETKEDFEWGLERLRSLPWTRLHVFPYSERQGTPATRLSGVVPQQERASRAKQLRALSLERIQKHHQSTLSEFRAHHRPLDRVLIESAVKGPNPRQAYVGGYSTNYLRVVIPVESIKAGEALKNQIVAVCPESLLVDSNQGDVAFLGTLA